MVLKAIGRSFYKYLLPQCDQC